MAEKLVFIFELLGTAAFAASGGLAAIEKKLDFLGIFILAATTAVGGGIIRDLILGRTPPMTFLHPVYIEVAAAISVFLMFLVLRHGNFMREENQKRLTGVMGFINIFDAVGLGVFTIVGMDAALRAGYVNNWFLTIFVGVVTGVGGGMMRDVLLRRTPLVLKKDIYAMAAVIGAVFYLLVRREMDESLSIIASIAVIFCIRMVALCRNWNLPSVPAEETAGTETPVEE